MSYRTFSSECHFEHYVQNESDVSFLSDSFSSNIEELSFDSHSSTYPFFSIDNLLLPKEGQDFIIDPTKTYPSKKQENSKSNDNNTNSESNNDNKSTDEVENKFIKNKRGRKNSSKCDNKRQKHDKFSKDNIKRKIQVHYLKFLLNLINLIIKETAYECNDSENIKFYPIKYEFKKNVNKKSFDSLKKKTIGEIFIDNISPKFKNINLNKSVYNKIIENPIMKKILDEKYLEFFNVFYYNLNEINLSKYCDKDKNIILSQNIGFYKDLIKLNKTNIEDEDIKYRKKIEKCIKTDFLNINKSIFIVHNNK